MPPTLAQLENLPIKSRGFSYIEALVALIILSVALIPAIDALKVGFSAIRQDVSLDSNGVEINVSDHQALINKMEALRALIHGTSLGQLANSPSGTSTAHGTLSDPLGTEPRCLVYTSWYKPEGITTADRFVSSNTGLLWIKVQISGKDAELVSLAFIP